MLSGRRSPGVDSAFAGVLSDIEQARTALDEPVTSGRSLALGPGSDEPPPIEELQEQRREARARGDRAKVAVVCVGCRPQPVRPSASARRPAARSFRGRAVGCAVRSVRHPTSGCRSATPPFPSIATRARTSRSSSTRWTERRAPHRRRRDLRLQAALPGARRRRARQGALESSVDRRRRRLRARRSSTSCSASTRRSSCPAATTLTSRCRSAGCGPERASRCVSDADVLTVSNGELEARYGGVIVPHARDESVFDPARFDRAELRSRLGLRDERSADPVRRHAASAQGHRRVARKPLIASATSVCVSAPSRRASWTSSASRSARSNGGSCRCRSMRSTSFRACSPPPTSPSRSSRRSIPSPATRCRRRSRTRWRWVSRVSSPPCRRCNR